MAIEKCAVVQGEWQLDPDQVVRLYVRPTITLTGPGGTHHVPSFAEPTRRGSDSPRSASSIVLPSTADSGSSVGLQHWQGTAFPNSIGLESSPGLAATFFGLYQDACGPFFAVLVTKLGIVWNVADMDPLAIPVDEISSLNQYDSHFIQPLKRMRCNECRTLPLEDSR